MVSDTPPLVRRLDAIQAVCIRRGAYARVRLSQPGRAERGSPSSVSSHLPIVPRIGCADPAVTLANDQVEARIAE